MYTLYSMWINKDILYCIVLYCIVLYCIVLYCIVLYCIVVSLVFRAKYIFQLHV